MSAQQYVYLHCRLLWCDVFGKQVPMFRRNLVASIFPSYETDDGDSSFLRNDTQLLNYKSHLRQPQCQYFIPLRELKVQPFENSLISISNTKVLDDPYMVMH